MIKNHRFVSLAGLAGVLLAALAIGLAGNLSSAAQDERDKIIKSRRQQPGTDTGTYSPQMHELYDGKFRLAADKIYMVGGLHDEPGWDHIDNDAKRVHLVAGTASIDVDEIKNTGKFMTELQLPEGKFKMVMDRFHEFQPCQDGGIATWVYEHGDSGCGDANWPKTLIYIAGWGYADAWLDNKLLYKDHEAHFMVTQGIRDRKTLKVHYPVLQSKTPAGQVNPAAMQVDFYMRSKEADPTNRNNPPRKVFAHFFGMEITWK